MSKEFYITPYSSSSSLYWKKKHLPDINTNLNLITPPKKKEKKKTNISTPCLGDATVC